VFLIDQSAARTVWRRLAKTSTQAILAAVLLVPAATVQARDTASPQAVEQHTVALAALPAEAQNTYRLVHAGGPFPYDKDGTVFGNRERLLPSKARGYYREYTVRTPGARNRGARRVVCGGKPPTRPEACYYTDDHYASFRKIAP
jgi:ribonuclease T1